MAAVNVIAVLAAMMAASPPTPFPAQLGNSQTPQSPQPIMPVPSLPLPMKSVVTGETAMAQMPDALAPQPAHTLDAAERMSFIADKASPGRRAASRTETLQNLLPPAALRQRFPVARLEPLADSRLVLQPAIPKPFAGLMDLLLAYPLARLADAMLADLLTGPAKPSITGSLVGTPNLAMTALFARSAKSSLTRSHAVTAQIAMPRAPKLAAVMHPRSIEPVSANARACIRPMPAMAHVGTTATVPASVETANINGNLCQADRSEAAFVQSVPREILAHWKRRRTGWRRLRTAQSIIFANSSACSARRGHSKNYGEQANPKITQV